MYVYLCMYLCIYMYVYVYVHIYTLYVYVFWAPLHGLWDLSSLTRD